MYMYRKLLISAIVFLALVSCTKEAESGDVQTCFRAYIDRDMATLTKSGDDTETLVADKAVFQAWKGDVKAVEVMQTFVPDETAVTFSGVKLVIGVEYEICIMVYSDGYYDTSDLRSLSLATDKDFDGKTAQFDAFCYYSTVTCGQDDAVHDVTLKRPLAKVSFSAAESQSAHISFTAPTTLNLKTGAVSGSRNVEYTATPGASGVTAFDYVFATDEVSQLSYTFKLGEDESRTTQVPVKRNTKTNIIHNITN